MSAVDDERDDRSSDPNRRTIVVLVENRDGVLARVSGLFYSRGYDLESICLGRTLDPSVARITLVVPGDETVILRVIKQLEKLIDVIKVVDLTKLDHIEREMVLVRITPEPAARDEALAIAAAAHAHVLDEGADAYTLEVAGDPEAIDAFIAKMRPFSIGELVRTGTVAMARRRARTRPAASEDLQRRHRRDSLSFEVRVSSSDPEPLFTHDISRGGLSLCTERQLEVGSTMEISLVHRSTGETFVVGATVRRQISRPNFRGVALEFTGLDDDRRRKLGDFIGRDSLSDPDV